MFLSYHIFSCKIYCSSHQLHFFPWPITLCFPLILLLLPQKRIISQKSPLLRGIYLFLLFFFLFYLFFFKYPNENMATACNKNQSYYAFDGFFLTDHHITIYRTINLPNQIQSKKEKHSYCWGLGNAVCDLPSQYVNRVTICFHQISQQV